MTRTRHALSLPVLVLLVGAAVSGCGDQDGGTTAAGGGSSAGSDAAAGAEDGAGSAEGADFCTAYADAGGTLATPGTFQVGMPAGQTVTDLSGRIDVLDAVTPPDDIAADWQSLHDLYSEALAIAEEVPAEEAVVDPRVLEIAGDLREPGTAVRTHLDEKC